MHNHSVPPPWEAASPDTAVSSTAAGALCALRNALRAHRSRTPRQDCDRTRAAASDIRTGYLEGMPVPRLVITLRARGCAWVPEGGGCLMCGHWAGTASSPPDASALVEQFTGELARRDTRDITVLSIYNSGSMLNPDECDPDALAAMLRQVREYPSIRKVVLESRARYVTRERVEACAAVLGQGRRLVIAMGLETADDLRRDLCVNKGCTVSEIARALGELRGVADSQLYVLVGLPFLTEREAIEDAVAAIRAAHALGAGEIHIEPVTLQRHTLLWDLHAAGLYRLPSLHSIYAVLRAVTPDITPYISPFLHMPLPDRIPEGCSFCTDRLVRGLLDGYNIHRTAAVLSYDPCICMEGWRRRLDDRDDRPLPDRILAALDTLAVGGMP